MLFLNNYLINQNLRLFKFQILNETQQILTQNMHLLIYYCSYEEIKLHLTKFKY